MSLMSRKQMVAGLAALSLTVVGAVAAFDASTPAQAREAMVYKSPTCGCCKGWVRHLQMNGYKVTVVDREDMEAVKDQLGVPAEMRSCHTARIDGYVVEGHVPVEAIDKLFSERPNAVGIASPGMPSGSPGMDGPKEPNPVYTFGGGGRKLFGTY